MAKRVGVLMGGWGEERDISMKTGEAAVAALTRLGHKVTPVVCGPGLERALRARTFDVAFLALHGRMGEDGRLQGMLEVLEIPYTGSGVLASALAMNKPFAKRLFHLHNLPSPPGYSLKLSHAPDLFAQHGDLGYPCIVKPACGGSSVGTSLVLEEASLPAAVREACRFGGEALIERRIEGQELTVAVLEGEVLGSCEMSFAGETFDFAKKYEGGTRYHLPPRLSPTRLANVERLALGAYRALGCRGHARVDLLSSEVDNDVLLEVNTLPGMTPTSLFPKIAAHAGLTFDALCERILAAAALDQVEVEVAEPADVLEIPTRIAG